MYRGNLQKTGVYYTRAARTFADAPNWSWKAGTEIMSSVVLSEGLVYFGTLDRDLYAVHADSGLQKWKCHCPLPEGQSGAFGGVIWIAVAPGVAVFATDANYTPFAVDFDSGALLPYFREKPQFLVPPIVYRDMLFTGGAFYGAADVHSGRPVFIEEHEHWFTKSPVVFKDRVYWISGHGDICVYDTATDETWQVLAMKDGAGDGVTDWAVSGGVLYVLIVPLDQNKDLGQLYALDLEHQKTLWGRDFHYFGDITSIAVDEGVLFFGDDQRLLHAFDLSTYSERWRKEIGLRMVVGSNFLPRVVISAPSIAEDLLYIGANDGILYVLDKATGEERYLVRPPSRRPIMTAPAIADGVVYFGDVDGNFYAWGTP